MLMSATAKEVKKPTVRRPIWSKENRLAFLARSRPVAASMVGTARRKENSTIVFLFNPRARPPIIVAAARETPGMKAAA